MDKAFSRPLYSPFNPKLWQGRVDTHEPSPAPRWHQQIQPLTEQSPAGIALLGICSDEGVRRNQGRPGAVNGPDAVRRALAPLAWHLGRSVYDDGNLYCQDQQLEQLSEHQAERVTQLLDAGHLPLLIGGGHEIAYGSYLGLARHLNPADVGKANRGPIGIINFDAHFDLRHDAHPSSGTPFAQIAEYCRAQQQPFLYACLGVSETANTAALFQRADEFGVQYRFDHQLNGWQLDETQAWLERYIAPLGALYLTIDLDVLPAATMPGVSAPAARGVELAVLETLIDTIKQLAGAKLRLVDLAELNPEFDIDQRSAKVAARLIHQILR